MNLSGQSVAALVRHYGLPPARVLVIADDLDLPLGKLRLRAFGGAGGHNGHKSIIQALRSDGYPRLRIGVASPGREDAVEHVLQKFRPSERTDIELALDGAVRAVELLFDDGIEAAMGKVNAKREGEAPSESEDAGS
jgi:PTH1 family peptidyl-tRNA hydrolase